MPIRFSDNVPANADSSDFVVRRRVPLGLQILLFFISVFGVIYLDAEYAGLQQGRLVFLAILACTVGVLAWVTLFLIQRNRDLVLATEFQNTMLASAAQLGTKFCLICKQDGTIVYTDRGFQKLFTESMRANSDSIYRMLAAEKIPEEISQQLSQCLSEQKPGQLVVPFTSEKGTSMPMVVTIDVLPRPKGYYLLRGRDFVRKRSGASATSEDMAMQGLLMEALRQLPEGVMIANAQMRVVYASHLVEGWLGYEENELQSQQVSLEHLCYQYEGHPVGEIPAGNFEGTVTLLRRNRTPATFSAYQTKLEGEQEGICLMLLEQESIKKKHETAVNYSPVIASSSQLTDFITASPIAVARVSTDGMVLESNDALRQLTRQKAISHGGKFIDLVKDDLRAEVQGVFDKLSAGQPIARKPLDITLATDDAITASLYVGRLEGNPPELLVQLIDTTEQKNLEQRFAHSQKMQAVGQLAGGVAHDFNNLLTAMIGFCDLLLIRHPAGDQSFADIMQVKQNANRAANLVRQLLAFSRRQTLQPKMIDITDVLAELSNLIRRLIGENIELKVIHGRDLGMVKADQGQLEQVFINLAVNARDAMQKGGKLVIQTSHVTVDKAHPISRNLVPPLEDEAITDGDYVLVEVIDNGTGIPRKLLQKIFEPFFSTKEVGSGTGLGLATVYGIIKQTGGFIYVSSTEGKGTNFSLFLKRYQHEESKPAAEQAQATASDDLTGKGTILLVEDETPVRTFAARALRNKGYTVLEADCGENAVEVMDAQGSEVDVIISDVIMPGMNGPTMIETIAPKFPRVKVIFISGYAEDIFVKNYGSEREFNFLPKPFTLKQLASKVKEVMSK